MWGRKKGKEGKEVRQDCVVHEGNGEHYDEWGQGEDLMSGPKVLRFILREIADRICAIPS